MIGYEEALLMARDLKPGIVHCVEFIDAYMFSSKEDEETYGGSGPCVILKETGQALNLDAYFDDEQFESTHLRDFDV